MIYVFSEWICTYTILLWLRVFEKSVVKKVGNVKHTVLASVAARLGHLFHKHLTSFKNTQIQMEFDVIFRFIMAKRKL